ncbi:adenylyl-sulfate kinase [Pseudomonas sp. KU26590]|uniref:adenylyl-sulfate kinase n=1 Tax=Pseudomonas sp. KU26590 TaxID=2991051 RepID=UPI00223D3235|nr:adenylyl-sulfate kinase [Pseudomonas sp. KU26590]UZJ59174.1 adenylyl-sulfate kinase [Pseudomonas sp. KU26590]
MNTHNPGLTQHNPLVPYPFSEITPAPSAARPSVIWLTGLSAAGKSTIVDSLNPVLRARGLMTCILDGDSVRTGLCRDLSFSAEDREENVRRVAEVAALMVEAGLTVMVALISPTRSARKLARSIVGSARFVEVFVDVPLAVAEARDPKGLYRRARAGRISGFTGLDSAYEPPEFPELHIRSDEVEVGRAVRMIDDWLLARG